MDPALVGIISTIVVSIPVYVLLRANLRKAASEPYAILIEALNKSGHTIDDLFGMLADVPQLRTDLSIAQSNIVELTDSLKRTNRRADFFVDFARTNWLGAQANAKYIRDNHFETPPYVPPDKFPTGPLAPTEAKA
jgi:hypothetical protein